MQIRTGCPTGCKYKYVFYDDTLQWLDNFVKWLRAKEKHGTVLLMSVDDIANAVEKYKTEIERGIK